MDSNRVQENGFPSAEQERVFPSGEMDRNVRTIGGTVTHGFEVGEGECFLFSDTTVEIKQ